MRLNISTALSFDFQFLVDCDDFSFVLNQKEHAFSSLCHFYICFYTVNHSQSDRVSVIHIMFGANRTRRAVRLPHIGQSVRHFYLEFETNSLFDTLVSVIDFRLIIFIMFRQNLASLECRRRCQMTRYNDALSFAKQIWQRARISN